MHHNTQRCKIYLERCCISALWKMSFSYSFSLPFTIILLLSDVCYSSFFFHNVFDLRIYWFRLREITVKSRDLAFNFWNDIFQCVEQKAGVAFLFHAKITSGWKKKIYSIQHRREYSRKGDRQEMWTSVGIHSTPQL